MVAVVVIHTNRTYTWWPRIHTQAKASHSPAVTAKTDAERSGHSNVGGGRNRGVDGVGVAATVVVESSPPVVEGLLALAVGVRVFVPVMQVVLGVLVVVGVAVAVVGAVAVIVLLL